jgi:hypothetical protein
VDGRGRRAAAGAQHSREQQQAAEVAEDHLLLSADDRTSGISIFFCP